MSATTKQNTLAPRHTALPRNKKELLALLGDNPAPEDIVEQAREIKESVLMAFGLEDNITASVLYTKCHHQIPTTGVRTMAVMLLADGTAALLYNPYFTVSLGEVGTGFVLSHEARHLIYRHLYNDPQLRADPVFTTACELGINHDVQVRLNRTTMPTVTRLGPDGHPLLDENGNVLVEPTGIDPRVEYAKYVKDLKGQKLTPVSYADFVRTDFGCYTELRRMKSPPQPDGQGVCVHGDDGDGKDGDPIGLVPMDGETAADVAGQVLRVMMTQALNGSEKARRELTELANRTEDASERTTKLWGDLGLGRLRGQTLATRKVDWWKQWLGDMLTSRLRPGDRLIYNKKRGALDILLGNDPILSHRGKEEERLCLVAIDTSASMPAHVLEYLTQLVGHTDGVEFRWLAFDGAVQPFVAGEAVRGGGGTSFAVVMEYAEGRLAVDGQTLDIEPEAVLMLTDGQAPPIRPAEPDKWVWLITENGDDDWIRSQPNPMDSHRITTGDGI